NVFSQRTRRCRRAYALRSGLGSQLSPRRALRGQNSEGCQAGGSAGGAADEVRVRDQSQDGKADRSDDSAERSGKGGQSNTVGCEMVRRERCVQVRCEEKRSMKAVNRHWSVVWSVFWFVLSTLLFALYAASATAQQPAKVPRIGFLWGSTPQSEKYRLAVFQQGLQALGYVEGKTILVEHRYAEGKLDKFPETVAKLVALKPDVIIATALTAIRAA